jgi:hypothetical protein
MGDGLLLLSSDGGGTLVRPCLIQALACGSDESFLLSMCGSSGGLSHGCGIVFLPLDGGGDNRGGGDGLLAIDSGDVGGVA